MSLFPIETTTVTFRGKHFVVREMTAAEKVAWATASKERPQDLLFEAALRQTNWEVPMTIEQLREEPASLIERLAQAVFDLSDVQFETDGDKPAGKAPGKKSPG